MSRTRERLDGVSVGMRLLGGALLGCMAIACGPAQPRAQVPISREERLSVLRCYADAFEFRYRTKVQLTRKDLDSADSLFASQEGSTKRSCDLIKGAFLNEECRDVSLEALAKDPNYCVIRSRLRPEPNINRAKLHEWKQNEQIEILDRNLRRD